MPTDQTKWIIAGVTLASVGAVLLYSRTIAASTMPVSELTPGDYPLRLGDTIVTMRVRRWKTSPLVFLNVHENEVTSVDAAASVLSGSAAGGILIQLRHGGDRFISFRVGGRAYSLDPNRIFTDAGAAATVTPYDPSAVAAARTFAGQLLSYLPAGPVVALHNNTTGEPLTVHTYEAGRPLAREAASVHIEPGQNQDDFFLVTTAGLFNAFAGRRFNTVLQNNAGMTDDGSLSVYYGRRGLPYVNIEAEHGAGDRQKRMVQATLEVMSR